LKCSLSSWTIRSFAMWLKRFLTYRAPVTHRHDNKSQKNGQMKLTLQQLRYFCKANEMFKTAQEYICEKQEILSTIVHTSFHV
jgi:hypothetical protein